MYPDVLFLAVSNCIHRSMLSRILFLAVSGIQHCFFCFFTFVNLFLASSSGGPDGPDLKYGFEELCPVCGDKVSGYHYGLLTCESCKGTQNMMWKKERNKPMIHYYLKNNNLYYQLLYQLRVARVLTKQCKFINYVKYVAFIITIIYIRIDRLPYNLVQMLSLFKRCAVTIDPGPYLKGQGHTIH